MSTYYAQWPDGFEVTWRNLTWAEYRKFKDAFESSPFSEPMDVSLDIYELVRIKGPVPKAVPAGIAAFICKQQMINNPFSGRYKEVTAALEMARRVVVSDYLLSTKAIVASTFNYTLEEIDTWDVDKFFVRLAQAEIINGKPLEPQDPTIPKDSKGKPIKLIKRTLTPAQQKAIDRSKQDRSGG